MGEGFMANKHAEQIMQYIKDSKKNGGKSNPKDNSFDDHSHCDAGNRSFHCDDQPL